MSAQLDSLLDAERLAECARHDRNQLPDCCSCQVCGGTASIRDDRLCVACRNLALAWARVNLLEQA